MVDSLRPKVLACPCCGLLQRRPDHPVGHRLHCSRCDTRLRAADEAVHGNARTLALALAALILYPIAVSLPILHIHEFGHSSESSILTGTASLWASGQIFVGTIVLLCSVLLPIAKLAGLIALSSGAFLRRQHRARTYHWVEWTGRWGMLDVLLVAVLVAAMKLGDLVEVNAGPGAAAFAICVILSLLASASFDPRLLWHREEDTPASPEGEASTESVA